MMSRVKTLDEQRAIAYEQVQAIFPDEHADPLEVYDDLVNWTLQNYQDHAQSGLTELLEECLHKFKNDSRYTGAEFRWVKLWIHFANHVERPSVVFAHMMEKGVGKPYSLFFEQYAEALEREGRYSEAETVLGIGIRSQAKPMKLLIDYQTEYGVRRTTNKTLPPKVSMFKDKCPTSLILIRSDPLRNIAPKSSHRQSSSSSLAPPKADVTMTTTQSILPSRMGSNIPNPYVHLNAPPPPGKRPEKLMFDLTLLLEPDGTEYCFAEVRARHLGLLGKKWPSPPPPNAALDNQPIPRDGVGSDRSVKVEFNDQGTKNSRAARRQSVTVTINTKEALADVFDMYNSTSDMGPPEAGPSSVVQQEAMQTPSYLRTPAARPPVFRDENAGATGTKPKAFEPFVDPKRENITPAAPKFKPVVSKTPIAFTPRQALASKDVVTPVPQFKVVLPQDKAVVPPLTELKPVAEETDVFGGEDVTIDATEEITNVAPPPPPRSFVPFVDKNAETRPFLVQKDENAFSVHRDENAFPIHRDENGFPPPKIPKFQVHRDENVVASVSSYSSSSSRNDRPIPQPVFHPKPPQEEPMEEPADDEEGEYHELQDRRPMMSRFAAFDVMTPITERTYEFTNSSRAVDTPGGSGDTSILPKEFLAHDAAERLAAELREEEERERGLRDASHDVSSILTRNHDDAMPVDATNVFLANSGFRPPNPCNPADPEIVSKLLSSISQDPNHRDLKHIVANRLQQLQTFAEKRAKPRGSTGSRSGHVSEDSAHLELELDGDRYEILDKLGEGGFGAVFMARDLSHSKKKHSEYDDYLSDEDDDSFEDPDQYLVAIKAVRPSNLWETYVLRRILSAVSPTLRRSIVHPHRLYAFRDESFLVLSLCRQGTLLDVVNHAPDIGVAQPGSVTGGVDELLVMFFTIELLRLLEGLHEAGFIHGDLKIDNCLVRLEEVTPASAWNHEYSPSGDGGWSSKGLTLIDFGRTIDTQLYPPNQTFIADWKTDTRDCAEMRAGRPWTFQTDFAGLASIIYCMLFGKYIETTTEVLDGNGTRKVRPVQPMKRYWQIDLWNRLFDVLLNSVQVEGGMDGARRVLTGIREELEEWVRANCNKGGKNLKGMLKKIEIASMSRRR